MKHFMSTLFSMVLLVSCAQTQSKQVDIPAATSTRPVQHEAVATFAQGCFWHTEIVFQSLTGVRDAVSGYSGGQTVNPTYEQVCTGKTGHAECVQVYYDPEKISFETLVDAYFASMDPTTLNRQGNDIGTEYRSIAFYRNENEKKIIETAIERINAGKKFKGKVVTEVRPFKVFYPAETYHQEYILNHPENPYVQRISIPEFQKFKHEFKGNFKK